MYLTIRYRTTKLKGGQKRFSGSASEKRAACSDMAARADDDYDYLFKGNAARSRGSAPVPRLCAPLCLRPLSTPDALAPSW